MTARSEEAAFGKIAADLEKRVEDDDDALEHFTICSVEEDETV